MASYFNIKKLRRQSKQHDSDIHEAQEQLKSPPAPVVSTPGEEPAASPVLDEEDEEFLERLAAIAAEPEGTPPPLPTRPTQVIDSDGEKKLSSNAQEALMDGAEKVPLPMSPPEVTVEDGEKGKEEAKSGDLGRKKSVMSYFSRFKKPGDKEKAKESDTAKERKNKDKKKDKVSDKDRVKAASSLHDAAEAAKSAEEKEAKKEEQDLSEILDQLNLSAVNNRVFSFSKESEELLNKFKLVLKDVVNGAPHAYKDMEKLFTDYEGQLKKMYGSLPPFLQNLVKSLPAKITAALGPEIMAAQAEKPGFDAKMKAAGKATSKKAKIPSLKTLISAEGAVATMLRSILNFLKLRFPAVMTGTNVLLSLAVFLLMFVFWYCHKRGRETRLEQERLAAEEADSAMASSASSFTDDADSVFGEKTKSKSKSKTGQRGESSSPTEKEEKAEPPLIISDGKDADPEKPSATVEDMPSVLHLPDPKSVPLPEPGGDTPAKEEPLRVPGSK